MVGFEELGIRYDGSGIKDWGTREWVRKMVWDEVRDANAPHVARLKEKYHGQNIGKLLGAKKAQIGAELKAREVEWGIKNGGYVSSLPQSGFTSAEESARTFLYNYEHLGKKGYLKSIKDSEDYLPARKDFHVRNSKLYEKERVQYWNSRFTEQARKDYFAQLKANVKKIKALKVTKKPESVALVEQIKTLKIAKNTKSNAKLFERILRFIKLARR